MKGLGEKGKTNFKGELFSYMNCNYFKNDICDIYARVLASPP